VITEITQVPDNIDCQSTVYYDGDCRLCRQTTDVWAPLFQRRGYRFVPLQQALASGHSPFPAAEFFRELKLQRADGRWLGGADACLELCRAVWWLKPLAWVFALPGLHHLLAVAYRQVAQKRHCLGGTCKLEERQPIDRGVPLLVFPLLAFNLRNELTPWGFMLLMAFAIFFGFKWLTLRSSRAAGDRVRRRDQLVYLFLWPGMSFVEFAGRRMKTGNCQNAFRLTIASRAPLARCLAGAGLVWGVVPAIDPDAALIRGWLGMAGLILLLHFGTFDLLALALQLLGYGARPLMNAPWRARSLSEFWGRRWNTAFNALADRHGFRNLKRWLDPRLALLVVFASSGIVHELVITLPAGGGYGLPTLYFALQAVGLLMERHPALRLHPARSRVFTWLILVVPVGALFPPVFIHQVMLPMLHTIGAT